MTEPLLRVEDLSTHIVAEKRVIRAVDGVSFVMHPGETFALLGESGCGKSVTALSIMRLLPPAARIIDGTVRFHGNDLLRRTEASMRAVRGGRLAMIFQEPMTSLNPVLTVGQQIAEAVRLHDDIGRKDVHGRMLELLHSVGIPDPPRRAAEYPHQLSGGMKQRVMISIALAGNPELLIADEPTTALDVTIQAQVLDLLRELQEHNNMALLIITHDLGVVAELADRVAVMYAGQIVEKATRQQFFENPRHPYTRKLFDSLPETQKRDTKLYVIPGAVPNLEEDFVGCRFAPRCYRRFEQCTKRIPPWVGDAQQGVRCHLFAQSTTVEPALVSVGDDTRNGSDRMVQDHSDKRILEVQGLKVFFPIRRGLMRRVVGQVRAVDGVDLSIERAQTIALVGESGCGKTTVGKGIIRLIRPTAGSVRFSGCELTKLRGRALRSQRAKFQIVFQDPFSSMNPRMLVGDILEEGMQALGIATRGDRRDHAAALLERVGLHADAVARYPHEFSGGQRQRIAIARALAVRPQLLVCDEPTSALDVSVQAQILNLLKQLQSDLGISYLFITHNISVVAYLADEVAVMYLGRIVERGLVSEVLERPAHPYTQALLSAVPRVHAASKRKVIRLEGDLPSPASPPTGCHFHPRCPRAVPDCRLSYPKSVALSTTHKAHCLRIEE